MRHSNKFHLLVCALFSMSAASQPVIAANAYRKLTGAEIKVKVTNMKITDDPHFSEQYMRDGSVRIVTLGRRIIGKWPVEQGNSASRRQGLTIHDVPRSEQRAPKSSCVSRVTPCQSMSLSRSSNRAAGNE